jgi:hypothetical protein
VQCRANALRPMSAPWVYHCKSTPVSGSLDEQEGRGRGHKETAANTGITTPSAPPTVRALSRGSQSTVFADRVVERAQAGSCQEPSMCDCAAGSARLEREKEKKKTYLSATYLKHWHSTRILYLSFGQEDRPRPQVLASFPVRLFLTWFN